EVSRDRHQLDQPTRHREYECTDHHPGLGRLSPLVVLACYVISPRLVGVYN
ncbi:cdc42, partial [Biomphalaria pfeifferi]